MQVKPLGTLLLAALMTGTMPLAAYAQVDSSQIEAEEATADAEAAKAEANEAKKRAEEDRKRRDKIRAESQAAINKARSLENDAKKRTG
ncbi:hypothetical protein [Bdellovibrio bacteriovorus]|uniref:hypothetical protein n=1 Tax=Bdellovibrio bacteriovorus TaxID=959 RepID=UPI0035A5AB4E